jgi:uncharacterized damage-inducible protein DinB
MDTSQAFLRKSRDLLAEYREKIDRSLEPLSDADVWWRANDHSNSIGNLILHLCGNVTQWIAGGVGRRPYERLRQQEFDERRALPKAELLGKLGGVVATAEGILADLDPSALTEPRRIQGYDVTVLDAVYHVVEHFSMHTGQIILLAKARAGIDLGLWQPPA